MRSRWQRSLQRWRNGCQKMAGVRKTKQLTITLPQGERSYMVVIAATSDEYPQYTGYQSEFDNVVDWQITPAGGTVIAGSKHVNDLHADWEQSETDGTSLLWLSPVAIVKIETIQGKTSGTTSVQIELGAKNVSDALLPSTLAAAVLPVEISLRAAGNIEPAPENGSFQNSKASAGGTDVLGPLPMGTGRWDHPGQAYTAPIQVIGTVPAIPTASWRWKRFLSRRSWTIWKDANGNGWTVALSKKAGTPSSPEDDTGSPQYRDETPSPSGKIYIYDASAMLPATTKLYTAVGDYLYVEKQFTYQIEINFGGTWLKVSELDVGQTIVTKRVATGDTAAAFQGLENLNQARKLDVLISTSEVRAIVGGTLPIVILQDANN